MTEICEGGQFILQAVCAGCGLVWQEIIKPGINELEARRLCFLKLQEQAEAHRCESPETDVMAEPAGFFEKKERNPRFAKPPERRAE